jgi:hypothetical protein
VAGIQSTVLALLRQALYGQRRLILVDVNQLPGVFTSNIWCCAVCAAPLLLVGATAEDLQQLQRQQQNGHFVASTTVAGDGFADDGMPGEGRGDAAADDGARGFMREGVQVDDLDAQDDNDGANGYGSGMEQQQDGDDGDGSDYKVTEADEGGEGSEGDYNPTEADMEQGDEGEDGAAMEAEQY